MTDCLIIGFNDMNFDNYLGMVRSMGVDSGAYKDLNLAFIEYENKPFRAMDILNHFYFEDKPKNLRPFHFADFLWPVVSYLGTYLSRRGFSFDYINLFHLEKDKLKEKLLHNDILTIAVTTTLYVVPQPIMEVISFIKQYNERVKIIVGGPYIANIAKKADRLSLEQQLKSMDADFYVFSAEGEATLVNLLQALKSGTSLDAVDNIAYRNGKRYVLTATSIESNTLEENLVDYTLFPAQEVGNFVSTRTAKSCPFACSFCNFPQQAGRYKYTGVELVEEELNAIQKLGSVTTLTFIDDTFNVPPTRFKEILHMMIRNKYEFKWNCTYRCDHGDEETIELMGKAGCEGVFMGLESASDTMLHTMNKTARRADYLKAVPLLKEAGILAHANLFIGFPGETYETVQESIDFIKEVKPETYSVQLWYANPLTPIWNRREEFNIRGGSFNWSHNTMDSRTACDLIDKVFLSIDDSVFLPQYGFFQWCLFYLQRKGMNLEQIRTFMHCFNALVKEKLLFPEKKTPDTELMAQLKRSCQFDKSHQPEMEKIEIFSGTQYLAAEEFCKQEFAHNSLVSTLETLSISGENVATTWTTKLITLAPEVLTALRNSTGANLFTTILSAYSVLLWRLNGLEETCVAIAYNDGNNEPAVAPLKIAPGLTNNFPEFLEKIAEKSQQTLRHKLFAMQILTNTQRMHQLGGLAHIPDAGYLFSQVNQPEYLDMQSSLKNYPQVSQRLGLALEVYDGAATTIRLKCRLGYHITEKVVSYLTSILTEIAKTPDVRLLEIRVQDSAQSNVVTSTSNLQNEYVVETFDF
ncbi:MAG: PhpK family radical SAM P-methyltransferase [Acidobacteriota bacterium]